MAKYRKRPVVVEAFRWQDAPQLTPPWFGKAIVEGIVTFKKRKGLEQVHIETLEGVHIAHPGDWIIQGIEGELYSCKPGIFEQTYELNEQYDHANYRER